jgi:hypothetical protein
VANPWASDRPAGGWPPEGCSVMTHQRPPNYYLFSVCQIMANTYKRIKDDSVVIELDGFEDFDSLESSSSPASDLTQYTKPFAGSDCEQFLDNGTEGDANAGSFDVATELRKQMQSNVTDMLWQSGRDQAQKAFNMYAKIDILRPHFDVEPVQVRNRLLASFVPVIPTSKKQASIPGDLYGPCMVIFTLIAILLFQMKGKLIQRSTLETCALK